MTYTLLFLIVMVIIIGLMFILQAVVSAEKRECKDLVSSEQYNSEGHDDNKQSSKEFHKSLKQDSLCEFTEKHDKEEIDGVVKDYTKFKESSVYKSANEEQKECLNEGHDSPDKGKKALQGYEIEWCGWYWTPEEIEEHKHHD